MGSGAPPSLRLLYDHDDEQTPDMDDGNGLAEALLGLDGFRVLEVSEVPAELSIEIETTVEVVGLLELWNPT